MNTTFCHYCGAEVENRFDLLKAHQADRTACPLAVGDWILVPHSDEPLQIVGFTRSFNGIDTLVLCSDECEYNPYVTTLRRYPGWRT